jgi:hypothetical protein
MVRIRILFKKKPSVQNIARQENLGGNVLDDHGTRSSKRRDACQQCRSPYRPPGRYRGAPNNAASRPSSPTCLHRHCRWRGPLWQRISRAKGARGRQAQRPLHGAVGAALPEMVGAAADNALPSHRRTRGLRRSVVLWIWEPAQILRSWPLAFGSAVGRLAGS